MHMTAEEIELKNKFENWAMKIQTNFIESPLFQPVGLELSCTSLIFEMKSDYPINFDSKIAEDIYPIAYYRPDTDSIHIFIEHESFKKRQSDQEKYAFLLFLLFHEANHKLLFHIRRGKDKDSMLWNIAADMEIHNTFYIYFEIMKSNAIYQMSNIYYNASNFIKPFLFDKIDPNKSEGLWEKDYLQNVAEEIYNDLEQSKVETIQEFTASMNGEPEENDKDSFSSSSVKVTVSKYKSKGGKEFTVTNIEFPEDYDKNLSEEQKQERENSALARKALMENTLQKQYEENVRSKGDGNSPCDKFLQKLFHVKIDWKKILKSSLATALEKSEYFSWAKPRTSLFALSESLYLPSQYEDDTAYGTLIIARDESGSMSNDECRKAASIILEAKDYYNKIVLIKHDTQIVSVDEFTDIDDDIKNMVLTRKTEGGTSHKEVFEFIRDYQKRNDEMISCCIFMTDLYSDIEETQNIIKDEIPRIYLCPTSCKDNDHSKIKGKIIGIE